MLGKQGLVAWIGGIGGSGDEIPKRLQLGSAGPIAGPYDQVCEIDISSEILSAGVGVNVTALEPLVMEIGANGATRSAVIEKLRSASVIDRQQATRPPLRQPVREPLAV